MIEITSNEEKVLEYWKSHGIAERMREKNAGKKPFYFLDGPPFVSGDLHPGQIWVKTIKDVILRYRRYRGFNVHDKAGYDVHGLPIEHKIEESLGIKSKKDIEDRIGVEVFISKCREFVESLIGRMDADYYRFGMSLNFADPYIPSRFAYMETAWSLIKKVNEKGLLYKGLRPMTYCKHCGTVLAQGSLEIEYQEDTDPSVFVAFKAKESSRMAKGETYLLVWTTTPWTLPANMAIAANPKELYVRALIGGRRLILAKARMDAVVAELDESAVIEAEFYGSELEGLAYVNPLEGAVPKQVSFTKYHKVIMAEELVSSSEGSGLVHMAPGHGLEDYSVGIKNKLPVFSPIGMDGRYTAEAGKYVGLAVPEEANKRVIDDLLKSGNLLSNGKVKHSYPHCWRCGTKLIYIATEQWFINIQKVKRRILSENSKVTWHPKEAKEWQANVISNSPDWTISRQRYWGIPIPIWECSSCGRYVVVGSLGELSDIALDKSQVQALKDLHKPYIDRVLARCQCGGEMRRISDVFDVWFDSGIAFRAGLTEKEFGELFPINFILEGRDQLRGWFSYQLKISTILYGSRPFKDVAVDGMLLAEDGRQMHKHLGNYVSLGDLLKISSADSFRIWCSMHTPWLDLQFNTAEIKEAEKNINTLYNIANLIEEYKEAIGYRSAGVRVPSIRKLDEEERWILSRFTATLDKAQRSLDNYEVYSAAEAVRNFIIEDFSRFYLKIAKKKILYNREKSKIVMGVVDYVFYNSLVILSPIAPFCCESIYLQRYKREDSIFLEDWPAIKRGLYDASLEADFRIAASVISAVLNSRDKSGIKLRWPLAEATVEFNEEANAAAAERTAGMIEEYTNVKKLVVKKAEKAHIQVRPRFSVIGPMFKDRANDVAEAIKNADPARLSSGVSTAGYFDLHTSSGTVRVGPETFEIIKTSVAENAIPFEHGIAYVNPVMNQELMDEALLREFERRVQIARKDAGFRKAEKAVLRYAAGPDLKALIEKKADDIKSDLNLESVEFGVIENAAYTQFEVEGTKASIQLSKPGHH